MREDSFNRALGAVAKRLDRKGLGIEAGLVRQASLQIQKMHRKISVMQNELNNSRSDLEKIERIVISRKWT